MFTRFMDMHSGGGTKIKPYEHIYIEANSESEAKDIFRERFDRDPDFITCHCCGADYSVSSEETLELATAYERGSPWNSQLKKHDPTAGKISLTDYCLKPDVLIIRKQVHDINTGTQD
jgi:hypothetical protein